MKDLRASRKAAKADAKAQRAEAAAERRTPRQAAAITQAADAAEGSD